MSNLGKMLLVMLIVAALSGNCFANLIYATGFEAPEWDATGTYNAQLHDGWTYSAGTSEIDAIADGRPIKSGQQGLAVAKYVSPNAGGAVKQFSGVSVGYVSADFYVYDRSGYMSTTFQLKINNTTGYSYYNIDPVLRLTGAGPYLSYKTWNGSSLVATSALIPSLAVGWNHFEVSLDYAAKTYTMKFNGTDTITANLNGNIASSNPLTQVWLMNQNPNQYGSFDNFATYVPEPATIGLLAIGGISLLFRRK